jgi:hypothetical protein
MLTIHRVAATLIITLGASVAACDSSDAADDDAGSGSEAGHPGAGTSASGTGGKVAVGGTGGGGKVGTAGHSGAGSSAAGHAGAGSSAAGHTGAGSSAAGHAGAGSGGADAVGGAYGGPTVGTAKRFAVLAYDSVTTANTSTMVGSIGVSAAALSVITGFDDPMFSKFGNDSLAPDDAVTGLAQGDVTKLVTNIDMRACDDDLTNVLGGLTGDVTLHPGVTCMNSFSADVLVDGHVYLDAGGDPNAFFIIRGNKTLTVADGAKVVLMNEARDCGVFWRISEAVTIGKTVELHGTVVAGTAITMKTASTLNGRALAQTAGVQLDANTLTAPTDSACPHTQ